MDEKGKNGEKTIPTPLKGGYRIFFIGPVGHNIWWENSRNGSFGSKQVQKRKKSLWAYWM